MKVIFCKKVTLADEYWAVCDSITQTWFAPNCYPFNKYLTHQIDSWENLIIEFFLIVLLSTAHARQDINCLQLSQVRIAGKHIEDYLDNNALFSLFHSQIFHLDLVFHFLPSISFSQSHSLHFGLSTSYSSKYKKKPI